MKNPALDELFAELMLKHFGATIVTVPSRDCPPGTIRNMAGQIHSDRWPGESDEHYAASLAKRGITAPPAP